MVGELAIDKHINTDSILSHPHYLLEKLSGIISLVSLFLFYLYGFLGRKGSIEGRVSLVAWVFLISSSFANWQYTFLI